MLYPFQEKDKYGFINDNGEVVVPPIYTYVDEMSEGLAEAIIGSNSEVVFMDEAGEIIVRNKSILRANTFTEGLSFAAMSGTRKWGFIDRMGEVIIDPIYEEEYSSGFSEGLVDVCKNGKWGYINQKGEQVIPFEYDWTYEFSEGFAVVQQKRKKFFINREGEKLKTIKCRIEEPCNGGFKEGLAVVKIDKKFGMINTSGELAIEAIYDYLDGFHNGLCGMQIDGKCGFINKEGAIVIEPRFSRTHYFHHGISPATEDGKKWGLIDLDGQFIKEPEFDYITDFTKMADGLSKDDRLLTRADIGRKEYYINLKGEIVAEAIVSSKQGEHRTEMLMAQLKQKTERNDVWEKAKWAYDGFSVTKKGAIKPIYFVLKWLKSKDMLTAEGLDSYKDKNNLEIGLYRFMMKAEAADFLDRFYKAWYDNESIANFQLDPSMKFEKDEGLDEYWQFYLENK